MSNEENMDMDTTKTDREKHLEETISEWRAVAEERQSMIEELQSKLGISWECETPRCAECDCALKYQDPEPDWVDAPAEADQDTPAEDWRDAWYVRDRDGSIWIRQPKTHKWICVEFNGIHISPGDVLYESELDNFGPITIINDLDEEEL